MALLECRYGLKVEYGSLCGFDPVSIQNGVVRFEQDSGAEFAIGDGKSNEFHRAILSVSWRMKKFAGLVPRFGRL
jgi:hypothetical protein